MEFPPVTYLQWGCTASRAQQCLGYGLVMSGGGRGCFRRANASQFTCFSKIIVSITTAAKYKNWPISGYCILKTNTQLFKRTLRYFFKCIYYRQRRKFSSRISNRNAVIWRWGDMRTTYFNLKTLIRNIFICETRGFKLVTHLSELQHLFWEVEAILWHLQYFHGFRKTRRGFDFWVWDDSRQGWEEIWPSTTAHSQRGGSWWALDRSWSIWAPQTCSLSLSGYFNFLCLSLLVSKTRS